VLLCGSLSRQKFISPVSLMAGRKHIKNYRGYKKPTSPDVINAGDIRLREMKKS